MQKFKRGNKIKVNDNYKSFFIDGKPQRSEYAGLEAIVIGSYADQFGGDDTSSYTLLFDGECSWFPEKALILLDEGGEHLIEQVKRGQAAKAFIQSDLKWIMENWERIKNKIPGASICTLMSEIGITNPWGNFGEGVDYYNHAHFTFKAFDPILMSGNLERVKLFILEFPKINGSFSNTEIK